MAPRAHALLLALGSLGCGGTPSGGPTGALEFFVSSEESITAGLVPGGEPEDVVDGWSVAFDRYLVAVGHVSAARRATGEAARDDRVWVVDLAAVPATGVPLLRFEGLSVGTFDEVRFRTTAATPAALRDATVEPAAYEEMVAGGCTYLVEGTLSSPTGTSTPPGGATRSATAIAFRLCVPAPTSYGPCSTPDGMEGVVVTAGGTTSTSLTFHGDHLFFDAFPSGDELVRRRAQWLADADVDGDGAVTGAELAAIDAAALFPTPDYSLAGAPVPIESAWDFVVAQLSTQGHLNGEGECPAAAD